MRTTSLLLLTAALAAPACTKTTPPAAAPPAATPPAEVKTAEPAAAVAPAAPAPNPAAETIPTNTAAAAPPSGGDDQVRPPTAADLDGYVADLKGKGPLMARIETSLGTLNCELAEKQVPMTVANFVGLARGKKPFIDAKTGKVEKRPYYEGLTFHRVIPQFMIQGGDPTGVGSGGPGYKFPTESHPELLHDRPGVLAMANSGPDTNGSQFYVTEVPVAHLDSMSTRYNVFGRCKEVAVVKKIASVPAGAMNKPVTPVVIKKITISRR